MIDLKIVRCMSLLFFASALSAEEALPKTAQKFEIDGHTAFLYAAPTPAKEKPWVWFAPTLKGVSLVLRKAYFEGFLRAGLSIAGYDIGEVRGAPASGSIRRTISTGRKMRPADLKRGAKSVTRSTLPCVSVRIVSRIAVLRM